MAPPLPSTSPPSTPARRRSQRRRWLFRAVLVGFVGTLLLVATELALRLWWQPPPAFRTYVSVPSFREPEPGTFEPLPHFVGAFAEGLPADLPPSARFEPRVLDIRTNSLTLRGPELEARRAGERRILFGGDSLTFGHGVAEQESFPAQTAQLLRDAGIAATACNAGVPGSGFVNTTKRLARLRDPVGADALVAAYFLGNDCTDDIWQRSCIVVTGRMFQGPYGNLLRQSWRARLSVRSRAWLFVETWLIDHQPTWSLLPSFGLAPDQLQREATLPQGRTLGGLFLDAAEDHVFQPGRAPAVRTWLADLEPTLQALRATAGALPLLVVVLPTQFHVDAGLRAQVLQEIGLDAALLQPGAAQARIERLCASLGIACIDATPALAATSDARAVFDRDHLHLSIRGNAVVARLVADWLRERWR